MKLKINWHSAIAFIAVFLASVPPLESATITIDISNFAFAPQSKTINVGDTVMWMNSDSTSHTSTSGPPGSPSGTWNSGLLAPGQSFSFTFNSAGTFPYFCAVHTFMTGTITVQSAQAAVPVVSITSPANNAMVAAGTPTSIEATASVTGGNIVQIEFFDGSTSLGIDMTSPYSVSTTLPAGTHSLTAKAS